MRQRDLIGPFEQLVMTAIYKLEERAYGMAIHEEVADLGGRYVRLGAVYMTLERMREKGYLKSWETDPTPQRGGRARKVYALTALGRRVLDEATEIAKRMAATMDPSWGN